jgi:Tol biopolymer transport system component
MVPRVARNGWLVSSNVEGVAAVLAASLVDGKMTGKPRKLIASSHRDRSPSYSPDGGLIAFSSDRGGSRQLWVCARDGTSPRQITHLEDAAVGISSWAPSGGLIAFEAQSAGSTSIHLCDSSTGRTWKLPLAGRNNRRPSWSRDGKTLYYSSNQLDSFQIWSVQVDGEGNPSNATQITRGGGFGAVVSADGRYLYYSKGFTFTQLCRVSARGGLEEDVLGAFPFNRYPVNLAAGDRGLYFRGRGDTRGAPVWLLPYAGGRPVLVMMETAPPSPSGLAVSPGDTELLLPVFAHASGDIVAVKKFK